MIRHDACFNPADDIAGVRMLYVLLTNPFKHHNSRNQGSVDERSVLRMHLQALIELQPRLVKRLMIMVPTSDKKPDQDYLDVNATITRLPFHGTIESVPNNTLGSYGMYLEAFSRTRRDFYDYYIFSEDDYIPVRAHFDAALARMYTASFGPKGHGFLTGTLQGRPLDPTNAFLAHPESSAAMSGAALEHLFKHTYDTHRWNGSVIERSFKLLKEREVGYNSQYFDRVQLGFGSLMRDAKIPMRDWTSAYRTPYWGHSSVSDWTGAAHNFSVPNERVLFAPVQWLFEWEVDVCCVPDCGSKGFRNRYPPEQTLACVVQRNQSLWAWVRSRMRDEPPLPSTTRGCCPRPPSTLTPLFELHANWSVPAHAYDVVEARASMAAPTASYAWGSGRQRCTLQGARIEDMRHPIAKRARAVVGSVLAYDAVMQAEYRLHGGAATAAREM